MKVYNSEVANAKSWAISLQSFPDGSAALNAVDAITGNSICELIVFPSAVTGFPRTKGQAKDILSRNGYDPYEHGYLFNGESGAMIVD